MTTKTYRVSVRQPDMALSEVGSFDDFIQLKAPNAERAMQLAHQVTGKAVIDATRIEVPA